MASESVNRFVLPWGCLDVHRVNTAEESSLCVDVNLCHRGTELVVFHKINFHWSPVLLMQTGGADTIYLERTDTAQGSPGGWIIVNCSCGRRSLTSQDIGKGNSPWARHPQSLPWLIPAEGEPCLLAPVAGPEGGWSEVITHLPQFSEAGYRYMGSWVCLLILLGIFGEALNIHEIWKLDWPASLILSPKYFCKLFCSFYQGSILIMCGPVKTLEQPQNGHFFLLIFTGLSVFNSNIISLLKHGKLPWITNSKGRGKNPTARWDKGTKSGCCACHRPAGPRGHSTMSYERCSLQMFQTCRNWGFAKLSSCRDSDHPLWSLGTYVDFVTARQLRDCRCVSPPYLREGSVKSLILILISTSFFLQLILGKALCVVTKPYSLIRLFVSCKMTHLSDWVNRWIPRSFSQ